jgi:hypothetical protein
MTNAQREDWPACATYPNLGCACRGALFGLSGNRSKATCTRKRTGDLTPIARYGEGAPAKTETGCTEPTCRRCGGGAVWCGECGLHGLYLTHDCERVQADIAGIRIEEGR